MMMLLIGSGVVYYLDEVMGNEGLYDHTRGLFTFP